MTLTDAQLRQRKRAARKHGLNSVGSPAGIKVDAQALEFRRSVEYRVLAKHGDDALTERTELAALVNSAFELHKSFLQLCKKLRVAGDIAPEIFLDFQQEKRRLLEARDAKIAALGLPAVAQGDGDMFARLYDDEPDDAAEGESGTMAGGNGNSLRELREAEKTDGATVANSEIGGKA